MNDDDDAWLEALAGRAAGGPAAHEGALLRDALRRLPVPALAPPPVEAVLAAAEAGGLLRRRLGCPACAERWRRWRQALARPSGWAGAMAVAAAIGWVVVGLQTQQPVPEASAPVLRAPADGVWLRRAAEPAAARDRLAVRLQAAGVAVVHRYERLGRAGLDADLPAPLPPALAALLREEAVAPAADGSLRVEFTPE